MTDTVNTEERPSDGAVRELARDDLERKKFLKMAGKTMGSGAAAAALGTFIAACGSSSKQPSSSSTATSGGASAGTTSTTSSGNGDLAIVNYALTLEYLESQFYDKVAASGLFHGATLAMLKSFGAEEHAHAAELSATAAKLGTPAPVPKSKFPIHTAPQVTKLAATVENLGAAAYLGQAGNIQSKEILAAALAIHTVEGRHAATLNTLLKTSITPDGAFAKPKSMTQVLAAVKPFMA